jgi:hypothetical protein
VTAGPVPGARPARLWAKGGRKVNQGKPLIGIFAGKIAIVRNP